MSAFVATFLSADAVASCAVFAHIERRLRPHWRGPEGEVKTVGSPYRGLRVRLPAEGRAPLLVLAAALSGVLLGNVAVPGVLWAMATWRFDGLALSLLPGIASAAAVCCAGWLLLARSRAAVGVSRSAARMSQVSGVMLAGLSALHVFGVFGGDDRISHPFIVLAFALAVVAFGQGALLHLSITRHVRELGGEPVSR